MNGLSPIRFVPRKELDEARWNQCIDHAGNGLLYAKTFYLDAMARHWDALVEGDYESVMPLTWNRKYGVHYLYQPFLTAQLGVFGRSPSPALVSAFLQAIPARFRYWDICLNAGNFFPVEGFPLYERINHVLDLSAPYPALAARYRENTQRNIKRTADAGCTAGAGEDLAAILQLATDVIRRTSRDVEENIRRFRTLYDALAVQGMTRNYGVRNPQGQLLASAVFLLDDRRAYYLLVGNHPDGRTLGASHALIDAFIRDHAGSSRLLDFEGSDLRNLAFFYSSFGARVEKYPALQYNRLPKLLRWLKK